MLHNCCYTILYYYDLITTALIAIMLAYWCQCQVAIFVDAIIFSYIILFYSCGTFS